MVDSPLLINMTAECCGSSVAQQTLLRSYVA